MKIKISKLDQLFAQAHALHQSGQLDAAEPLYRKLLRKTPNDIEALFLLGTVKMQQGDFDAAQPLLQRVLSLNPQHAEALNNLGMGLNQAGRYAEGLELIEQALQLRPNYADALNNLGGTLGKLERLVEADAVYRRLIELEPRRIDGYYNLGLVLRRREQRLEAEACLLRVLELDPDHVAALSELGAVYHEMGRLRDGVAILRRALALQPDFGDVLNNLGACLQDLGQHAEALEHYQTASIMLPDGSLPRWNMAYAQLAMGNLSDGWETYERRWGQSDQHPPFPAWQGEDLSGRSLLVYPEQGLGDEILFASCLPDVLALARRVTIICERRLGALYARSFPTAEIYATREPISSLSADPRMSGVPLSASWTCFVETPDYQIPIGSLPRFLRTRLENFPDRPVYLWADPARVSEWRSRLAALGAGPKVGICWRSGVRRGVRHRYYTPIEAWAPILTVPGVTFINLQYDDCDQELAEARARFGAEIVNFPDLDRRNDQDSVAALMSALDLVVSAPTAVSALAAALGMPVLCYGIGWDSLSTDYYPWCPTMRLFAKSDPEAPWEGVTAAMAAALRNELAAAPRRVVDRDRGPPIHDPAAVLTQALAAHAKKDWDDAERRCRQVLAWHPDHADSWHLLGVVLRERGMWEQAVDAFNQAQTAHPQEPTVRVNRGRTWQDLGRIESALQDFRAALELDGNCFDARLSLGELLDRQGQWDEARTVLEPTPALASDPRNAAQAHYALAQALHHQRRLAEAEHHLREAVRLDPAYPGAHNGLGNALRDQDRLEEALACYQAALALRPDLPEFHNNLGNALRELNQLEASEAAYREALRLRPEYADAWSNLGIALREQGRNHEAIAACRRALKLAPDDAEAHWNFSFCLLQEGLLAEGWAAYEWRWRTGQQPALPQRYREWNGEDITGCGLLVLPEQGLGDEILFASCIPDLLTRAGHVVLACQQRLAPLYVRSFPSATVIALPTGVTRLPAELPPCDFQIGIGSLPRLLRPDLASFPEAAAYLYADPQRVDYWRGRLAQCGGALNIGICWRSGLKTGDRYKQYTTLVDWTPLFSIQGVRFVNLQYDDCATELTEVHERFGIEIVHFMDIDLRNGQDEVAALMSALDLIISADSAPVALAGALGRPVWRFSSTISWTSLGTDREPWHPGMRLFNKARPDEPWTPVFERMATALREWVAPADAATNATEASLQLTDTRHGPMLIAGTSAAARDLLSTGDYAPEALALLASLLRPGDWVVEAGADIGAMTLPLARIVGAEGLIVACESRPDVFRLLCANLALNEIEQVHAECLALDAVSPMMDFESPVEKWRNRRTPGREGIDALALPRCDLIRIGANVDALAVLAKARATLEQFKSFVHIEACADVSAICERLSALGYAWQVQNRVDVLAYPTAQN